MAESRIYSCQKIVQVLSSQDGGIAYYASFFVSRSIRDDSRCYLLLSGRILLRLIIFKLRLLFVICLPVFKIVHFLKWLFVIGRFNCDYLTIKLIGFKFKAHKSSALKFMAQNMLLNVWF